MKIGSYRINLVSNHSSIILKEQGKRIKIFLSYKRKDKIEIKLSKIKRLIAKIKGEDIEPIINYGCLYELKNGHQGIVDVSTTGSFINSPYVRYVAKYKFGDALIVDTIKINNEKMEEINRILIFAVLDNDKWTWEQMDKTLNVLKDKENHIQVIFDEKSYSNNSPICAIAIIDNSTNGREFRHEEKYFRNLNDMCKTYHWNIPSIS